jgi:hypothetical protein
LLEDRIQLGDTLLGLSAASLWAMGSVSLDAKLGLEAGAPGDSWHHGRFSGQFTEDPVPAVVLAADSGSHGAGNTAIAGQGATAPTTARTTELGPLIGMSDDGLAGQIAIQGLGGSPLPISDTLALNLAAVGGGGPAWPGSGMAVAPVSAAPTGPSAGSSMSMAATAGMATNNPGPVRLSFQSSTGQLAIQAGGGDHTVREAATADGFVDVTLDGQDHSSSPRSASFDSALSGATTATVAGIRFDGGGQDTLTLGSQHLAGGLSVQAAGATVVAQDVVTAGPLAIQAPDITVSGVLRGSTVALAASSWVNIEAAGRIDVGQSASGGRIDVAAGVFVNSGQLHADGPRGGQIFAHAGNVLNAGPVTADGAGPGGNGGQVDIAFTGAYVATTAAALSASSAAGPGGDVTIDGGSTGHLFSSGRHLATGSLGGAVDLLAREVVLAGAAVDASGLSGGGSVLLGGDFHGLDPAVVNAQTLTVTPASTIRADAQQSGSGGRVSVRANQTIAFDGTVSARGGPAGGSGGFIEVSGQGDLSYGASAYSVYFAGSGTQTLQSGTGSRFGNLIHSAPGTLQLASGLTVTGTLVQAAGTFDAQDQPITVGREANISGGTFLAGTAPLNFTGGLVLGAGVFTSSSGSMTVPDAVAVLGGLLSGEGTVGPVTALAGTVAPGGDHPGVLAVAGAATFFSSTTFRIVCNGPMPGRDYSQLQANGPIVLGNSSLNLLLGFEPPVGSSFEILTSTGSSPIIGTFKGLDEGAVFTQNGYQFQITYQGGTSGRSVVLTRLG